MHYEGVIQTNDKGELLIYNKAQFDAFFKENPGRRFVFKAERCGKTSSARMTAYYFAEVLPKIIKGFQDLGENHNKASMMQELQKYCTTLHRSIINGEDINNVPLEFNDLNFEEKRAHISECIKFASEQLHVVIEEPK